MSTEEVCGGYESVTTEQYHFEEPCQTRLQDTLSSAAESAMPSTHLHRSYSSHHSQSHQGHPVTPWFHRLRQTLRQSEYKQVLCLHSALHFWLSKRNICVRRRRSEGTYNSILVALERHIPPKRTPLAPLRKRILEATASNVGRKIAQEGERVHHESA